MHQRPNGTWELKFKVPQNGKNVWKSVYGKTQEECLEKKKAVEERALQGLKVVDQHTFEYYKDWWLEKKKRSVSESVYKSYASTVKCLEPLCKMKMESIRPADIDAIIGDLAKEHPWTGKPASKSTLLHVRRMARQIIDLAVDERELAWNPARSKAVEVPKNAPVKKVPAISEEQIQWIIDTPHRCQTAAMIMLFAGLRKSELLALTPFDVDLKGKTIRVCKKVEYIGSEPHVRDVTKTKMSNRLVTIPDILVEYLRENMDPSFPYIAFKTREPLRKGSFDSYWKSYMNDLDLKYGKRVKKVKSKFDPGRGRMVIQTFNPHQLRHTYATIMYDAGVDVLVMQKQLGHEDIQTTLGIYAELTRTRERRVQNKMNDYIMEYITPAAADEKDASKSG